MNVHPERRPGRAWLAGLVSLLLASGCVRTAAMPSVPDPGNSALTAPSITLVPTPSLSYQLPTSPASGSLAANPTPDAPHYLPAIPGGPQTYTVAAGDVLSAIAERFSVSVEAIVLENSLADADTLEVGQVLAIPAPQAQPTGPAFKLVPDSELVYGPNARLDVAAYLAARGGFLAGLTQEVDGQVLGGAEIVLRVAEDYSINPRLLLALLEYRTGWISQAEAGAAAVDLPFGYIDSWYVGLYRQLAWAAIQLNQGYYRWRYDQVPGWLLADGSVVPVDPTINAGTAGVQYFFAALDDYGTWLTAVSPGGFYDTFFLLFGNPFAYGVEPLIPADLTQPQLSLPFASGEIWSFTGGPHSSWDLGSPYGALDFAPPGDALGCVPAQVWVRAVADGVVVRTGQGLVVLDLDLDGLEQTGWVIVYMHIGSQERVAAGTRLTAGDPLGHPSCEGGVSTGTHVHIARRLNGEWLPSGEPVPFVMSGWLPGSSGEEYVGTLSRSGVVVESYEGNSSINKVQR